MEKSSETKFLMHLAVPESYSRWGWYFVAGSLWSIPVVGPPQLSEGFTISNCEALQAWWAEGPEESTKVAAIANLLCFSISRGVWRLVLQPWHRVNSGVPKTMRQATEYRCLCGVLINTWAVHSVIIFLVTKMSRFFIISRYSWNNILERRLP